MNDNDRELMCEQIAKAVKETVNGKITALDKKVEEHMKRVEPYLQAGMGINVLSKVGLTVGGLAAGIVALKQIILGHI